MKFDLLSIDASTTETVHRPSGRSNAEYSLDAICGPFPQQIRRRAALSQQTLFGGQSHSDVAAIHLHCRESGDEYERSQRIDSQHCDSAPLCPHDHEIQLLGHKQQELLSNIQHLEPSEFPSLIRRIGRPLPQHRVGQNAQGLVFDCRFNLSNRFL